MTRDEDRIAHLMGEPSPSLDEDERAALDDLRNLLSDPAVWVTPDPGLEDRVVAAISSEHAATPADDLATPVDELAARRRRRGPSRMVLIATGSVAAMVLAVVMVAGTLLERDTGPRFEVALAAVGPSRASGSASLVRTDSGWKVELDAPALPRLDGGRYYQAWLRSDEGILVPIGSFNEGREVILWSGVSPVDHPGFTVTVETADGNQASSGQRVLTGTVDTSR